MCAVSFDESSRYPMLPGTVQCELGRWLLRAWWVVQFGGPLLSQIISPIEEIYETMLLGACFEPLPMFECNQGALGSDFMSSSSVVLPQHKTLLAWLRVALVSCAYLLV